MPQIMLIRHAESLANAGFHTASPARIALTPKGYGQALKVAEWFEQAPTLIVTSSYLRTQQTAAPTLRRFPHVPHEIWDIHEFTYLSPLKADHTTPSQRKPLVQEYWACRDPEYCDGNGAESFAQFVRRVDGLLDALRTSDPQRSIALFTHGQFINMVLWRSRHPAMPLSRATMLDWRQWNETHPLPNAAILPYDTVHRLADDRPTITLG